MTEQLNHLAYQNMTVSFLEDLLAKIDQSDRFPEFAAQEFLELSGAKTASFIQCLKTDTGHHDHRILATLPKRRAQITEQKAFWRLVDLLHQSTEIQIWNPDDEHPASATLKQLGIGVSIAIPFLTSGTRAGGLLLFDLPELERVKSLLHSISAMSQVIALAMRSALLIEAQEQLIETHSAEAEKHRQSLQAFFDNKLVGMLQKDAADNYISTNLRWQEMTGYSAEELRQKCSRDLIHPEAIKERELLQQQLTTGKQKTFTCTTRYRRKDQSSFWGAVSATGLYDEQDRYQGLLALVVDVTEQRKAQLRLQHSEQRYRTLLNNQTDAVLLHKYTPDRFERFEEVNEAAAKMFGYSQEELLELTATDLSQGVIPDPKRNKLNLYASAAERERSLEQGPLAFAIDLYHKDGQKIPAEISSSLVEIEGQKYILSTIRDISERKAAEEQQRDLELQLRQKFKMEAVGVMAGGLAHNFNNNLSLIIGNIEMALRKAEHPEDVRHFLGNAKTAILRSRDLIKQIMVYSRQDRPKETVLRLNHIVEETLNLLRSTIPSSVEMHYDAAYDCQNATIAAEATRIQEALLNLCGNAVHAMGEEGQLLIKLDSCTVAKTDIPVQYSGPAGEYLRLSVSDSGCGMSSEVQDKIFDPFFTTKEIDQGTGMGLATVQGIVKQSNGWINVTSQIGRGTTFELYFPKHSAQTAEQFAPNEEFQQGTEKILFVEDDPMLADLGKEILAEVGYRVTSETISLKALELFQADPGQFDLLITDQTMPKMTGTALIQKLRAIRPDLPVILCTGHSSKFTHKELEEFGVNAFCMKPLEMSEMLATVRKTLDQNKSQLQS